MPAVQIADIYVPATFARRTQQAQTKLNRFLNSGVAVYDSRIADQLANGGHLGELSNAPALATAEPNYSNDDPANNSTPLGFGPYQLQKFRAAARNNSWAVTNLARDLALEDPVGAITGRFGAFWATDDETRLINSSLGILASNVANNGGDMVIDVSTDAAAAVTDAERISGDRFIQALQTMGDHKEALTTIAVHSAIHARWQRQNLIQFVRNSDNNIMFETYMGKRIIVDDSLPAVMGANRITYTSILFGAGVFSTAPGRVLVPSEHSRKPSGGGGGGVDEIYSRVNNVWHPNGFSFNSTTVTGGLASCRFASYADLKLAANWTRVWNRKSIPLAFLKTND